MMRNKASSSMQKTYDECYLICSTAVYFEGQNNEEEALRSWRSALDQIHYHNAYKVPPNHRSRSETEKALQDSLRSMEIQCKERVELLETIRLSMNEDKEGGDRSSHSATRRSRHSVPKKDDYSDDQDPSTKWITQGPVPPVKYPDLSKPPPPLPQRPAVFRRKGLDNLTERSYSSPQISTTGSILPSVVPVTLPVLPKQVSREPSPDKKGRPMLTTLRANKDGKRPSKSPRASGGHRSGPPPVSSKAAGLAWDSMRASGQRLGQTLLGQNNSTTTLNSSHRDNLLMTTSSDSETAVPMDSQDIGREPHSPGRPRSPPKPSSAQDLRRPNSYHAGEPGPSQQMADGMSNTQSQIALDLGSSGPSTPPLHDRSSKDPVYTSIRTKSPVQPRPQPDYLSYRNEYPPPAPISKLAQSSAVRSIRSSENAKTINLPMRQRSPQRKPRPSLSSGISRRPVANTASPRLARHSASDSAKPGSSDSGDENTSSSREGEPTTRRSIRKDQPIPTGAFSVPSQNERNDSEGSLSKTAWDKRIKDIKKHLPKGVDENAANQIFNEIVVQGDEVHWADVAGLDVAKKALKEAVVYPFLRPDLFMGLREPARGMLLFGPPGTGKTMLARAVATESRSTFFAISASSLTSKWLGESEKLVRALFSLAKALAPSIIFVDEIDSLLSSRGGSSEHESTRRIKTEFLIQWSDLQRAAAGKVQTDKEKQEGDASRVLVLAATNMPWAIDEAARRRFVRRQYIPLPEGHVRATQLRTLLGHQKHNLNQQDIQVLVELTDGFSGSDITALAKDAAMGPLRSLGEELLYMTMDEIRPIQFEDFEASLVNIRPSVSKQGLQEFEDWAKEFGERGG